MFKFRSKLALVPGLMAASLLAFSSVGAQGVGVSGISGEATTGVQIQNVSQTAGTVAVSMYPQSGGAPIPLTGLPLAKEGAVNYYLPSQTGLPSGSYSMVASSDQPIQAIVRTDWAASGGAAIYGSVEPSSDVIIPLVLKNFAGQTSQFTVQATADNTNFSIQIFGRGIAAAVKSKSNQVLANGRSYTYNLGSASETLGQGLPNTGADLGVATGFAGYARIRATSGSVVVQSFIDVAGSRGVTGFSGVPATSAATTLFAPLVRANFFGDTGIQLVNPGGTAANVQITFYSDAASPTKPANNVVQNIQVPANSSAIAFQGPGGNSRAAGLPAGSGQTTGSPAPTNNGWFGVAKITSSQPLLAVVNDTVFGAGFATTSASTYNAQTAADAGTRFGLPLVRSNHVASSKLTTGIQIQNTSGTVANVSMTVTCFNGQVKTGPSVTIQANGSGNLYQGAGAQTSLCPQVPANLGGAGWFGSAIIQSNQPVVLLVNDANGSGATQVLDGANYTGLKIQ